jgi:hypothetical protein
VSNGLKQVTGRSTYKKFALIASGLLQNRVDPAPCLWVLLESCHEGINLLALVVVFAGVHRHDDLHNQPQNFKVHP